MKNKVYSLTNYFIVTDVTSTHVILTNQSGQQLKTNKETLETAMFSASDYKKEEKVTVTELSNIIRENPNKAMSVYFQKVDKPKSKKAYKEELANRAEEVKADFMKRGQVALEEALSNPVLDYTPGEMRLIVGYNPGGMGENGFFNFIDIEDNFTNKSASINPRTIEYVIVNNVKYIKK